mgnify:CR=1 FL=1
MVPSKNIKILNVILLIASVVSAIFLSLVYLNYTFFKFDFVLIGVVQEMFTLPSFFIQPVIVFFSLRSIFLDGLKKNSYPLISLLISIVVIVLIVRSFL